MKHALAAVLLLILTACGSGSASDDSKPAAAPPDPNAPFKTSSCIDAEAQYDNFYQKRSDKLISGGGQDLKLLEGQWRTVLANEQCFTQSLVDEAQPALDDYLK
jgi:hypothetical protein